MNAETKNISHAVDIVNAEVNKLYLSIKELQMALFIAKMDEHVIKNVVLDDVLVGLEGHYKHVKFSPDEVALDPMLKVYKSKTNSMIVADLVDEQKDIISVMKYDDAIDYLVNELLTRLAMNHYGPDYLNK